MRGHNNNNRTNHTTYHPLPDHESQRGPVQPRHVIVVGGAGWVPLDLRGRRERSGRVDSVVVGEVSVQVILQGQVPRVNPSVGKGID